MSAQVNHAYASDVDLDLDMLLEQSDTAIRNALESSQLRQRMNSFTLDGVARISYLEQLWEGFRVLARGLSDIESHTPEEYRPLVSSLRSSVLARVDSLSEMLDRIHGTTQWRSHFVGMSGLIQLQHRVDELLAANDFLGLLAHAVTRMYALDVRLSGEDHKYADESLRARINHTQLSDEQFELLQEELSAALVLVLRHGSDICHAYAGSKVADPQCSSTLEAIRTALIES